MSFAAFADYFLPMNSFFNTVFRQTALTIKVFDIPKSGYTLNLIQLIILLILAVAVNAITERLTSKRVGGLFLATIITIIGVFLIEQLVTLPFDFAFEGIRIIAARLGAIIIAVFYSLIRNQTSSSSSKK